MADPRASSVGTSWGRPHRLRLAAAWIAAVLVSAACGGGGNADAPPAALATPATDGSTTIARGTLIAAEWGAYPRLVRLAHQADPARNGRIVATLTERGSGGLRAGVHISSDDGVTFDDAAPLVDAAFATGLCCGTLFEMPRTVGTLPAGTLLYAASVGADVAGTTMDNRIYRSDDAGASFRRIEGASCGRSAVPRRPAAAGSGVWEPEFLIAGDGSLACIYSDESVPGRSQVLALTQTSDGTTWSAPRVIVAGPSSQDRPGMAGVRRLPGGRYVMSLEACGGAAAMDCSVRIKLSDDGLDWGLLGSLGSRPQTASGRYLRHAPTLAWTALAGRPDGLLALIGQVVASDAGGTDVGASARVLFVNTAFDGAGDWTAVPAPIGLAAVPGESSWCPNYSTPLLPSADGASVLLMQTDSSADGGCVARFGQGALGR